MGLCSVCRAHISGKRTYGRLICSHNGFLPAEEPHTGSTPCPIFSAPLCCSCWFLFFLLLHHLGKKRRDGVTEGMVGGLLMDFLSSFHIQPPLPTPLCELFLEHVLFFKAESSLLPVCSPTDALISRISIMRHRVEQRPLQPPSSPAPSDLVSHPQPGQPPPPSHSAGTTTGGRRQHAGGSVGGGRVVVV